MDDISVGSNANEKSPMLQLKNSGKDDRWDCTKNEHSLML